MSAYKQGNSQGGSEDKRSGTVSGGGGQSGGQSEQSAGWADAEQGRDNDDAQLAFGQVRRADRVPRQRQGGAAGQSQQRGDSEQARDVDVRNAVTVPIN